MDRKNFELPNQVSRATSRVQRQNDFTSSSRSVQSASSPKVPRNTSPESIWFTMPRPQLIREIKRGSLINRSPLNKLSQSARNFARLARHHTNQAAKKVGQVSRQHSRRTLVMTGAGSAAALIILVGTVVILGSNQSNSKKTAENPANQTVASEANQVKIGNNGVLGAHTSTHPSFNPVAPISKPQLAKGGPGTAYDAAKETYKYTDVLGGATISVSQQRPPSTFNNNPDSLAKLATSVDAKTALDTRYGKAYSAYTNNNRSMAVLASVKGNLVTIQGASTMPATDIINYINSLN